MHDLNYTLALALGACLGLATLSASTSALLAVDVAVNVELFLGSVVNLFERHGEVDFRLGPLVLI